MRKFENLGRSLNKTEQKKIAGGFQDGGGGGTAHCDCIDQVGSWTYTSVPSCAEVWQDMALYCRYGAHCSGTCHA